MLENCLYKLYNVVHSNVFNLINQCITYVLSILMLFWCVNGKRYKYIAIGTNKHYIQQWTLCNIVPTIKTNVAPYLWMEFCILLKNCLGTQPWIVLTNLCTIHGMMGIQKLFEHNFYELRVLHNIEKDVCVMKKNHPLLVQLLFLANFKPSSNETCCKVRMLLFVDLLKPFMLFIGGVEIWAHSTWDVKEYSPSTKGFDVLMVTFSIDLLGGWYKHVIKWLRDNSPIIGK